MTLIASISVAIASGGVADCYRDGFPADTTLAGRQVARLGATLTLVDAVGHEYE